MRMDLVRIGVEKLILRANMVNRMCQLSIRQDFAQKTHFENAAAANFVIILEMEQLMTSICYIYSFEVHALLLFCSERMVYDTTSIFVTKQQDFDARQAIDS